MTFPQSPLESPVPTSGAVTRIPVIHTPRKPNQRQAQDDSVDEVTSHGAHWAIIESQFTGIVFNLDKKLIILIF